MCVCVHMYRRGLRIDVKYIQDCYMKTNLFSVISSDYIINILYINLRQDFVKYREEFPSISAAQRYDSYFVNYYKLEQVNTSLLNAKAELIFIKDVVAKN